MRESFVQMRKIGMKVNPEKGTFKVPSEKCQGFIVSKLGLKYILKKKSKPSSKCLYQKSVKDEQRLSGCMGYLERFLASMDERNLAFYQLLKRNNTFEWTMEWQRAFEKLKEYLRIAHLLVSPI